MIRTRNAGNELDRNVVPRARYGALAGIVGLMVATALAVVGTSAEIGSASIDCGSILAPRSLPNGGSDDGYGLAAVRACDREHRFRAVVVTVTAETSLALAAVGVPLTGKGSGDILLADDNAGT